MNCSLFTCFKNKESKYLIKIRYCTEVPIKMYAMFDTDYNNCFVDFPHA